MMARQVYMDEIHKSYFLTNGKEIPVLKGINLTINEGEFVALMGPSGSGKSTLLNIIGFLHPSTTGDYFFGWENVSEFKDDATLSFIRNQKCWFIFQQYYLIPRLSSLRNVMLPGIYAWLTTKEREKRAKRLLERVGLWHRLTSVPSELSGWEQQRVAIARALMNNPSLILADEPTGALDSATGDGVMEILGELHSSWTTIVMVTHEHYIAENADRIIYLRDGKVVNKKPSSLNQSPNV